MAQVGVFGGSFNPIHLGHLHIAALAEEAESLDRIVFVPAEKPPHKNGESLAPREHRVRMLELALAPHANWHPCLLELENGASGFTVDTLDRLAASSPEDEHVFIMGWDSLRDFPGWHNPEGILARHRVVAVDRPGVEEDVNNPFVSRVRLIRGNPLGITATVIRSRLARGLTVRYLLPEPVWKYLQSSNLYRGV